MQTLRRSANSNVRIEYRWADGHYERLPQLAGELIKLQPAALVAAGGEPSARAAKSSTATIPILFVIGGDPVTTGLSLQAMRTKPRLRIHVSQRGAFSAMRQISAAPQSRP